MNMYPYRERPPQSGPSSTHYQNSGRGYPAGGNYPPPSNHLNSPSPSGVPSPSRYTSYNGPGGGIQNPSSSYTPNTSYPPTQYGQAPPPYQQQSGYPPSQPVGNYSSTSPSNIYSNQSAQQNYNPPNQPGEQWWSAYFTNITPQEMASLEGWFQRVDRDGSGTIEAEELQQSMSIP
eukprot:TRINITY_DN3092_c0_g1_i1.p1 TRINITY_DN3092_c0_g1~~TRINITY_DN3092_c0_g1_i1.p1  ORF type:complete len:176 (+),score=35.43 TRINITY_DN3092_c0_g1_i1:25-552(+)